MQLVSVGLAALCLSKITSTDPEQLDYIPIVYLITSIEGISVVCSHTEHET